MSIPIPRICWAYPTITSGVNDSLVFTIGAGAPMTTASLLTLTPSGVYPTPEALLADVVTVLNSALVAAVPGSSVTGTVSATGFATVTCTTPVTTAAITMRWSNAPTAAVGVMLGFASAAAGTDQVLALQLLTGVHVYVGAAENQVQNLWTPGIPVRSDPKERSSYPRAVVETSGAVVAVDLTAAVQRRTIAFEKLFGWKTLIASEGPNANQALERLFVSGTGGYARFYWYDDATDLADFKVYALREKSAQQFTAQREFDTVELYKLTLQMTATM
jgi:hypothetical protein